MPTASSVLLWTACVLFAGAAGMLIAALLHGSHTPKRRKLLAGSIGAVLMATLLLVFVFAPRLRSRRAASVEGPRKGSFDAVGSAALISA